MSGPRCTRPLSLIMLVKQPVSSTKDQLFADREAQPGFPRQRLPGLKRRPAVSVFAGQKPFFLELKPHAEQKTATRRFRIIRRAV